MVFLAWYNDISDGETYIIFGVFSTSEKAKDYLLTQCDGIKHFDPDRYRITEFTLDVPTYLNIMYPPEVR